MNATEVFTELRRYIAREFLDGNEAELEATTPLLELGIIDSVSIRMMTAFVQSKFSIKLPYSELHPKNLANLDTMTAMVMNAANPPA